MRVQIFYWWNLNRTSKLLWFGQHNISEVKKNNLLDSMRRCLYFRSRSSFLFHFLTFSSFLSSLFGCSAMSSPFCNPMACNLPGSIHLCILLDLHLRYLTLHPCSRVDLREELESASSSSVGCLLLL